MGYRRYRGPVENVQQAMMAHAILRVTCQERHRNSVMWAWRIYQKRRNTSDKIPLKKPVRGFYCKTCRDSVAVILTPDGPWY